MKFKDKYIPDARKESLDAGFMNNLAEMMEKTYNDSDGEDEYINTEVIHKTENPSVILPVKFISAAAVFLIVTGAAVLLNRKESDIREETSVTLQTTVSVCVTDMSESTKTETESDTAVSSATAVTEVRETENFTVSYSAELSQNSVTKVKHKEAVPVSEKNNESAYVTEQIHTEKAEVTQPVQTVSESVTETEKTEPPVIEVSTEADFNVDLSGNVNFLDSAPQLNYSYLHQFSYLVSDGETDYMHQIYADYLSDTEEYSEFTDSFLYGILKDGIIVNDREIVFDREYFEKYILLVITEPECNYPDKYRLDDISITEDEIKINTYLKFDSLNDKAAVVDKMIFVDIPKELFRSQNVNYYNDRYKLYRKDN